MSFRPADTDDEEFFWYWRNRAEREGATGGWWGGTTTSRLEHGRWFRSRLGRITLLVWMLDHRPAGAVRIDSNGEVAFSANPLLAVRLLEELKVFAADYGDRLKVTVDMGNRPSVKALKDAGWREYPVRFFAYKP